MTSTTLLWSASVPSSRSGRNSSGTSRCRLFLEYAANATVMQIIFSSTNSVNICSLNLFSLVALSSYSHHFRTIFPVGLHFIAILSNCHQPTLTVHQSWLLCWCKVLLTCLIFSNMYLFHHDWRDINVLMTVTMWEGVTYSSKKWFLWPLSAACFFVEGWLQTSLCISGMFKRVLQGQKQRPSSYHHIEL